ncbi:phosphoadenosine phosphosulfate reductase [Clostridium sporogenes]|uniref:phosphoadenosine phosphosulfate reductase family protein n=1 Tax=Clostridium sporogenes TaxID=1509 RepID=UPI00117733AB|nr:phosphoadenosine phosphosulfate reductase family protein [Clostridium sporogenes]MBY7064395.1 phosphoadenosine phosphosulfate reductase family protein [Clostridium sporogenes]NFF69481.1 phosphoadenosine phosphosulfate reductase [Clostridium sporogenes]NFG00737.1 phosphoadenosine phosphosulfate reductase [Clostridium sporogenes]NFP86263.1 phosphoadenosine phosphosulfate reductase [Clostridium sporogenes]NFQ47939.1 phosphoadenosine phosphosulfate reductase [Clostridium sporogenes]
MNVKMAIGQLNIYKKTKLDVAIERAKYYEKVTDGKGYYLNYSGGKDSILTKLILDLADVKYDAHYNITGIDPPEVVYFIRKQKDIQMHQHEKSIFELIVEKLMPPTRMVRYCCEVLKEHGGEDRFNVTGVRWAESNRRKKTRLDVEFDRYGSQSKEAIEKRKIFLNSDNDEKRRMLEMCSIKGKHILNPIIDFTDEEVWEVIRYYNLEYPELYDQGFCRIGCIGCPLSKKKNRIMEFKRYPKFKENYIKTFKRMIDHRNELGKETQWKTGEEVFEWWMNG